MRQSLFQYAVLKHPTKEAAGKGERIIPPSPFCLAGSEQEVVMIVGGRGQVLLIVD